MGKRIVRTDLVMVSAVLETITVMEAGHRLLRVALTYESRFGIISNRPMMISRRASVFQTKKI